ncbi:hypothetical protein BDZ89DRAFT_364256 [Hymenopellis radicata]|nr:hypothetical protein BDZ89DRAFT_364256 [Hymenopellis radicata]
MLVLGLSTVKRLGVSSVQRDYVEREFQVERQGPSHRCGPPQLVTPDSSCTPRERSRLICLSILTSTRGAAALRGRLHQRELHTQTTVKMGLPHAVSAQGVTICGTLRLQEWMRRSFNRTDDRKTKEGQGVQAGPTSCFWRRRSSELCSG